MLRIFTLLLIFMLVSCSEWYRYPCQNPENWEQDFCKKPYCEISRSCPEHIFKEDLKDKDCKK